MAGAAGDVVEEIRVWRGRGEGRAPKAAQSLHPAQGLLTAERGDAPVSAQRGAGGRWEGFLQTCAFTGERRKGSSLPLLQDLRDSCKLVLNSTFIPIETLQQVQEQVRKDFKDVLHFRKLS